MCPCGIIQYIKNKVWHKILNALILFSVFLTCGLSSFHGDLVVLTGRQRNNKLCCCVSTASLAVQPSAVVIEDKERTCDSLLMCIVTVLSHGLRSGGGVGDVLRRPSKEVQSTERVTLRKQNPDQNRFSGKYDSLVHLVPVWGLQLFSSKMKVNSDH